MTVTLLVLMGVGGLTEWLWIAHAGPPGAGGDGAAAPTGPAPGPRGDATVWALVAASCAAMGLYVPLPWWAWAEDERTETKTLVLRHSQLVFVTAGDDAVVVDCLVPSPSPTEHAHRLPFTMHGLISGRRPERVSNRLRHWAASGALVDISLRRRGELPIARVRHAHHEVVLEFRSVCPAPPTATQDTMGPPPRRYPWADT
jgi:hypothetical protein